jgi:hypothetical protein
MTKNPLESLADYSRFAAGLSDRPLVESSTISVWSASPYTGVAEGEIFFRRGFRLRMREELESTSPHHKHVPPEIKRNRIPAPGISFIRPNLEFVVLEIEDFIEKERA